MTRAIVTGGTGFAGRVLVAQLAADGIDVHATSHGGHDEAPGATIHALDVTDAAAVRALVRDVRPDEIYHLAGITRPAAGDVPGFWDVNFGGARAVLDAAARLDGSPRVLLVGSAYAYAPCDVALAESWPLLPRNHYGGSKAAAEMAGRAYAADGLHVVLARPFNHSGPGQSPDFVLPTIVAQVARALAAGASEVEIELGNVDSVRDISDVRDVAAGYRIALANGSPGEAYNLGSGTGRTIGALVDLVRDVAGIDVSILRHPDRTRADDIPYLVADIRRLAALGWTPERSLESTVADMFEAHRDS